MGIFKSYILGEASPDKLNQLKYGQGEGPIVKKRIPTTIEDSGPKSNEITRRIDDLQRIAIMFTKSNGLKYLGNEAFLNTLNSEANSKRKTGVGKKLSQLSQGLLTTAKVVGSTLLQVPFNGTGTHFVRGFDKRGKRTFTTPDTIASDRKGVFLIEDAEWIDSLSASVLGYSDVKALSDYIASNIRGGKNLSTLKGKIEGSPFGLKPISDKASSNELDEPGKFQQPFTPAPPPAPYTKTNEPLPSYRKVERPVLKTDVIPTAPYLDSQKRENRIFQGDIAQRSKQDKIYKEEVIDGKKVRVIDYANKLGNYEFSDKINLSEPYKSDTQSNTGTRDIIKFRFAVITPDDTTYLHFRAFLQDFNDSYKGNWNTVKYVGRGENFYSYDSFDRDLSFSFTIAAQTREEMAPLYRKMAYLASSTAPTYGPSGWMRGTLTRITIGDYVRELPGYISSVTYDWTDGRPWEIAINNPEAQESTAGQADIDMQELPMVLNCSISFKPIHKFVPETGLKHYITTDVAYNQKSLFFKNGKPMIDGKERDFLDSSKIIY